MLSKASEADAHVVSFGTRVGGLRPSDTSHGFIDKLNRPSLLPAGAILLLGVVTGALALVALAGVALAAGRDLDAVQTAHTVFGMVLAAGDIAQDALVLVGNGHVVHLP